MLPSMVGDNGNVHYQTNLLAGYGSMLKHMVSFTNDSVTMTLL